MKILYAGLERENYNPQRGFSFEYHNFYLTLKNMEGVQVIEHPFDRILEIGRPRFNEELLAIVRRERPELFFVFMYTDELDPKVLMHIKKETSTKTVAWFADDYWRFWNYSRHWAKHFDFIVTTYSRAVRWYEREGFPNVVLSQWACNVAAYYPLDVPRDIDVSFVGQYKPGRGRIIRALLREGINVQAYGFGWPNGKLTQEKMLGIFSRSKINLNLPARPGLFAPRVIARLFLKKSINHLVPDFHIMENMLAYLHFPIPHTHARPFELAGCRAFVLSGRSEDISASYREGEEMVFYDSIPDLIQKIRHYLSHDEERGRIAEAGYKRTLSEHTYEKRFRGIFKRIGIAHET